MLLPLLQKARWGRRQAARARPEVLLLLLPGRQRRRQATRARPEVLLLPLLLQGTAAGTPLELATAVPLRVLLPWRRLLAPRATSETAVGWALPPLLPAPLHWATAVQSWERTASGLCRQLLLLLLPGATVESSQGTLEGTGLPLPQPVATSVGTAVLMQLRAIAVLVLLGAAGHPRRQTAAAEMPQVRVSQLLLLLLLASQLQGTATVTAAP
jgi:hypothetical protein